MWVLEHVGFPSCPRSHTRLNKNRDRRRKKRIDIHLIDFYRITANDGAGETPGGQQTANAAGAGTAGQRAPMIPSRVSLSETLSVTCETW